MVARYDPAANNGRVEFRKKTHWSMSDLPISMTCTGVEAEKKRVRFPRTMGV